MQVSTDANAAFMSKFQQHVNLRARADDDGAALQMRARTRLSEQATLRIGESGAVYFAVNGTHYGPVGQRGSVTSNLALSVDNLTQAYTVADVAADSDFCGLAKTGAVQVAEITSDFTCP